MLETNTLYGAVYVINFPTDCPEFSADNTGATYSGSPYQPGITWNQNSEAISLDLEHLVSLGKQICPSKAESAWRLCL